MNVVNSVFRDFRLRIWRNLLIFRNVSSCLLPFGLGVIFAFQNHSLIRKKNRRSNIPHQLRANQHTTSNQPTKPTNSQHHPTTIWKRKKKTKIKRNKKPHFSLSSYLGRRKQRMEAWHVRGRTKGIANQRSVGRRTADGFREAVGVQPGLWRIRVGHSRAVCWFRPVEKCISALRPIRTFARWVCGASFCNVE